MAACGMDLACENALLHELANRPFSHLQRSCRFPLGDPGSVAEELMILGSLKQADLTAEMTGCVKFQSILPEHMGRHGIGPVAKSRRLPP